MKFEVTYYAAVLRKKHLTWVFTKMELEAVLGYPDMSASYPIEKFLENAPDTELGWSPKHLSPIIFMFLVLVLREEALIYKVKCFFPEQCQLSAFCRTEMLNFTNISAFCLQVFAFRLQVFK